MVVHYIHELGEVSDDTVGPELKGFYNGLCSLSDIFDSLSVACREFE